MKPISSVFPVLRHLPFCARTRASELVIVGVTITGRNQQLGKVGEWVTMGDNEFGEEIRKVVERR